MKYNCNNEAPGDIHVDVIVVAIRVTNITINNIQYIISGIEVKYGHEVNRETFID